MSFKSLNVCLTYESMRSCLARKPNKNLSSTDSSKQEDLVPIGFGNLFYKEENLKLSTHRVNNKKKHKNTNCYVPIDMYSKWPVKILLDSGASASIVHKYYVRENEIVPGTLRTTMNGTFRTCASTQLELELSELNCTSIVSTELHVTMQKFANDIILLGRDLSSNLGLNLNFKNNTITCGHVRIDMNPRDCKINSHFAIAESSSVQETTKKN